MRGLRLAAEHAPLLRRLDTHPAVMRTLGGLRAASESAAGLQRGLDHWDAHGYGHWVWFERSSGAFLGRSGLKRDERATEVLYAFLPAAWGRGLATEAGRAVVGCADELLALPELVAFALTTNRGSQRVIEKLGFDFEHQGEFWGLPTLHYRRPRPTPGSA